MNRILNISRTLLWLAALVLPSIAIATSANTTPEALIQSTSDEMLDVIAHTKDRAQLIQAVETKVTPHFNFERMTRLAVGQAWQQATPAQQKALAQEFRTLLVRTYTNAFATANERKVSIKLAPAVAAAEKEVTVKTRVTPAGSQAILIDYSMESGATGWKVFDVMVDGISLVTNYRDSFAAEIRNSGVAGLINALAEKNRKNSGAPTG
jgi:phospholipid transport system substrate-binding protein